MGIYKVFSNLKKIESETAEFYAYVSKKIAHKYPEISQFLNTLAAEEKIHESLVDMSKNIFMDSMDLFLEKDGAEIILEEVLKKIHDSVSYFEKHWETLPAQDIVYMVADLELEVENKHHFFYLEISDNSVKSLLDNLRASDQAHKETLFEFLKKFK